MFEDFYPQRFLEHDAFSSAIEVCFQMLHTVLYYHDAQYMQY